MTKNSLVITIIVAVLVGALGFYGGMQYQKSQRGSFPGGTTQGFPRGTNQQGGTGRQGNTAGIRPISGEITVMDSESITVKMKDGSTKIVIFSDSTKINKTSDGLKSDLKTGIQVTAIGTENSDGSVTAQSISIGNGMFQGMPSSNQPGQNPPASPGQ